MRPQSGGRWGSWMRHTLTLVVLLALLVGAADLTAQTYEYEVVILHPPGLYNSYAVRMNRGTREVVGRSWTQTREQALLWTGAGTQVRSLSPGAAYSSVANGISGNHIGGTVSSLGVPHSLQAWAWGTYSQSTTGVSLHPPGMDESGIFDAGGGQFAGWAGGQSTSWEQHAMLWTSTEANAVVDLHPRHLSFVLSEASGIDPTGHQQVGASALFVDLESEAGGFPPNEDDPPTLTIKTENHALLWSGSAASAVDLHPAGFFSSYATAVAQSRQVGYGAPTGSEFYHALLWAGSAASVVDLHPAGFTESRAGGLWQGYQVGGGWGPGTGNEYHALLW